ncbi:hypothetical protein [Streptomyces sp. CB01580]|uniref:hypothetical protein n=1 Tax=Streptomyces sp. CB01580 TaxID=1703933 RepID=UPI00093D9705|nr:hypothetical protein [Streptomyces sp. CB01580]OKJ31352.1 hypothetical protein AMK22_26560 [Streptomyces sp. CB01580]
MINEQNCADGFAFTAVGTKNKVTKVTEAQVSGCEEAAARTVEMAAGGEEMQLKPVGMRQGASFASFASFSEGPGPVRSFTAAGRASPP